VFRHRVELVPKIEQHAELGSDRYHGLLLDPQSASLHPAKYVAGLASAATRAGARLFGRTEVTRLDERAGCWIATTPAGTLQADRILIATNGYTTGLTPRLRQRLLPIGSYVVTTERLDASVAAALLPRNRMAFDSKHVLHYFRLTPDRRLLFGGRAEFRTPVPRRLHEAADILRGARIEVFPQLADAGIDYGWGGNVAMTRDQLPHAGRLGGLYFAAGYCGHGVAMATWLGDQIARRMAGQSIVHPLIDQPFPTFPLVRGRPWFLPFVGAYYRVLDRIS